MLLEPIKFSMISNPDEALEIIKKDVGRIRHCMESALREDVCIEAVRQSGYALQYIKGKYQTEEIAFQAVSENGEALIFVDNTNRTNKVLFAAVHKTGDAIRLLSEKEQNEDVCMAAINQNGEKGGCIDSFKYIYKSNHTEKLCIEVARKDYRFILHISDENLTKDVLKAFIESSHKSFELISINLIDKELCELAVNKHYSCLAFVPDEYMDDHIIDMAIEKNGYVLQNIKPELITSSRAWKCIKDKPDSIRYVPINIRAFEMYVEAANALPQTLQYVHRRDWFYQIATLLKIEIM